MTNSRIGRFCATALFGLLLSTTAVPVMAQTLDELAVRGEVLAAADPLAAELRSRLDEAGRRGFDIGMGSAEGHTAYGPGKQARGDALPADQQAGYFKAVEYLITRNANLEAAHLGARVAVGVPRLAEARRAEDDPFFALGFDIATGLLSDRQGTLGGLSQSVIAANVRATLSGATQRGFDASARLQGSNYGSLPGKSTPITPPGDLAVSDGATDGTTDGSGGVDRVGSVPDVVGMSVEVAYRALGDAGYDPDAVEINAGPVQPPYDRVIGTTPAAGTTLRRGSRVAYQLPRAWVAKAEGRLNPNDQDTRLGFDLDTGKYARIDEGADIYSTSVAYYDASPYESERNKWKVTVHFNPNLQVVTELQNGSGEYETDGYRIYANCQRSFREPPPNPTRIGGAGHFCIVTDAGRTVRLTIVGSGIGRVSHGGDDGSYGLSHMTFAANASNVVKAQGRVRLGGPPSALSKLSICEKAKVARDRNSPAAPGLTQQCINSGGTVPQ